MDRKELLNDLECLEVSPWGRTVLRRAIAALAWQASRVKPVEGGLAERITAEFERCANGAQSHHAPLCMEVAALEAEIALAKKERDQAIEKEIVTRTFETSKIGEEEKNGK